jgi:hypothetical protein
MDEPKVTDLYNAYYFATGCGRPYQRDEEWLNFFGAIAGRIVSEIQPHSVLDAGCAMGFLVWKPLAWIFRNTLSRMCTRI